MAKDKIYNAFLKQRAHAGRRGIAFKFTFEEWVQWWKSNLGPKWFKLRGRTRNKYNMARTADFGPYAPDNVECITQSENMARSNYVTPRGGGALFTGRKHTKATLEKMSKIKRGKRNPFYGKKHSASSRKKMRQSSRYNKQEGR
jgi:NUMOD3 motif